MSHLPTLIADLALILMSASIITLLFKWLKQPLVLGYIVAGLLAGPYVRIFPTVGDMENINTWAEIGVVFLLFALGLEFSFKKLMNVGSAAFITATTEVISMLLIGFMVGHLLGWSTMNSVFLGGMLSMSSTTIIIKAFDDLGLRSQRFTGIVFGTLVVEDLIAILMMVILSTMAVSKEFVGEELLMSVLKVVFFLILWFLIGIFILPFFLKKAKRLMNNETLLIVSLGLCLGMVVLATRTGFSAALGAFIMGSILAETVEAEHIEHIIQPVKDLFGAIFFVSVGMLVNPAVLVQYAWPVVIITLVTLVGKSIFSSLGVLLSGEPLKVSVKSGFSLAQIGEFAFIIAGLGASLKVLDSFIPPIIVAVSVITTFTTPYFIRLANPFAEWLYKILPPKTRESLDRYASGKKTVNLHTSLVFPAFPRFDDCLPADFFDKTKPHIRNRSCPIQPAFLLHLADNMFQRLFFIRVQIQTRLNLLIAFCQLRCSKAHRNTRILRVIFDQMHNTMQAAVHRATVIIRITEILPSRFLLKMRYMKRMIDQLSDSFILCR